MSTVSNRIKARKQWPGLLAALGMTLVLGVVILALGANALFNANVVPALAAGLPGQSATGDQATIDQLQSQIAEYQAREQQYKTELQQAADQLNQTNAQLQQYQGILLALQNAGIIRITPDGQVMVWGGGFGRGEGDD